MIYFVFLIIMLVLLELVFDEYFLIWGCCFVVFLVDMFILENVVLYYWFYKFEFIFEKIMVYYFL